MGIHESVRGDDLLRLTGVLATAVTLGGVMAATVVSPSFRWTGNALSNLGVATTAAGTPATAVLFNGGLVGGGVLGMGFVAWAWRTAGGPGARVVATLLGLAMGAMAAVAFAAWVTSVSLASG